MSETNRLGTIVGSIILGGSLIVATLIVSQVWTQMRETESSIISMTGSARKTVASDMVKWSGYFTRNVLVSDLKTGYAQMMGDQKKVEDFLKKNGIPENEITVTPVSLMQIYKNNDNAPKEFTLTQNVTVESKSVEKVEALSKKIAEVINAGVLFSSNNLEYYYTKLAEERVSLLSVAIEDAKIRANEIVKNSGAQVGVIRSASMGVVQVLAPNSTDISDYGSYDTTSAEKEIMITVRAVFGIKR